MGLQGLWDTDCSLVHLACTACGQIVAINQHLDLHRCNGVGWSVQDMVAQGLVTTQAPTCCTLCGQRVAVDGNHTCRSPLVTMRVLDLSALPGTCVEQLRKGEGWLKQLRDAAGCHVQCVFPRVARGKVVGIASSRMLMAPSLLGKQAGKGMFAVMPLTRYTNGYVPSSGPHPALELTPVPEVGDEMGMYAGELVKASKDGDDLGDLRSDGEVKGEGGHSMPVSQIVSPRWQGSLLVMVNGAHGLRVNLEPAQDMIGSRVCTYLRVVRRVYTGNELYWD